MRERAEEIGVRLKVWSGTGTGTEVEIAIPGDIAFEPHASKRQRSWIAKLYSRKARAEIKKARQQEK
jgi:hypothetical protein